MGNSNAKKERSPQNSEHQTEEERERFRRGAADLTMTAARVHANDLLRALDANGVDIDEVLASTSDDPKFKEAADIIGRHDFQIVLNLDGTCEVNFDYARREIELLSKLAKNKNVASQADLLRHIEKCPPSTAAIFLLAGGDPTALSMAYKGGNARAERSDRVGDFAFDLATKGNYRTKAAAIRGVKNAVAEFAKNTENWVMSPTRLEQTIGEWLTKREYKPSAN